MLMKGTDLYPALGSYQHHYSAYGLAWILHSYKDYNVVMHTGSIDGMSAIIGMIPEENIGVYAFINSNHIEYRHAMMYKVFDILLGESGTDWSDKLYNIYHPEKAKPEKAKDKKQVTRFKVDNVLGKYNMAGSLPLEITQKDGDLIVILGQGRNILKYATDAGYFIYDPLKPFKKKGNPVKFIINKANKITGIKMQRLKFNKVMD